MEKYEVDNAKLKLIREEAHLNQEDIGNLIGKSSKNVSHYETGRAKPTADVLLNYLINFKKRAIEVAKQI